MSTRTNKYTKYQERGLSNEFDQYIIYYAGALRVLNNIGDSRGVNNIYDVFVTNNIGDVRGVNNIRDVFGDMSILMEIIMINSILSTRSFFMSFPNKIFLSNPDLL